MAKNRSTEAKRLKNKNRGKYKHRSGGITVVDGKGHVKSFTRQVINTGRGPNAERMQEYYQRLHSYDEALPKTLGYTGPMAEVKKRFDKLISDNGVDTARAVVLVHNEAGRLRLFFNLTQFFYVDEDFVAGKLRRSRVYFSRDEARKALDKKRIVWVEYAPSPRIISLSLPRPSG